jgi:hypothetical protein
MVVENGTLRRILGPKKDEETGGWRKLHFELHNLYSSPNIRVIKSKMIWVVHVAHMKKMRNAYILIGKYAGKRPLRRPKRIWEDI